MLTPTKVTLATSKAHQSCSDLMFESFAKSTSMPWDNVMGNKDMIVMAVDATSEVIMQ